MKLYYFPGACSLATHIVLEWIGAPYQTVRLDLPATKSPEFLALNPNGAVPLLVDGDFVLSQNAAILYYLSERHPHARLFGDGSLHGRAEVLRWLAFLNSDVHAAFKPIFKPGRFHPDASQAPAIVDTARTHVREYLERLDARLQGRDWLVDDRSVADPYLFVLLRWTMKLKIDSRGLDNVARFFARMSADASVIAAIAEEEGSADAAVSARKRAS
ncbi:MAG: glutathione binding-like protein [Steroidobacter sp.]